MRRLLITIICMNAFVCIHAQSITLLYKNDLGWNNPLSWIQVNTPSGQMAIQRVPTADDDVVISSSMSGIVSVSFIINNFDPDFNIGGSSAGGPARCRSMHVSNTSISFLPENFIGQGALVSVYTSNGGFVIIDSGSTVGVGIFQLHGGNATIADLQIINSTFGELTDFSNNAEILMDAGSKARLVESTYGGMSFGGGSLYAENSTINTDVFTLGDNSTDTIVNTSIQEVGLCGCLRFFIGRNANFVSSNVTVTCYSSLSFCTSGSILNGNVSTLSYGGGNFSFFQEDPAQPLPNIINGNLTVSENEALDFNGDVKISGDFTFYTIDILHDGPSYITPVIVNGLHAFDIGGIGNFSGLSVDNCCHFKMEFFGNTNSNISWPGGFAVDTLIINKTGCAKVTIDSSLYVAGQTRIEGGQLSLFPNDTRPYKFVCAGNVDIAQGAGLFLQKNAAGVVANMAVGGTLVDHNPIPDSTCAGLSNPYDGTIIFYTPLLPVTLLDFHGRYTDKAVALGWSTESEIDAKYFTVEKSTDLVSFNPITNITAAGNAEKHTYQYTDRSLLSGMIYYRLKMVDADSRFTYSKIIAIAVPSKNSIMVFPNPVKDKLFIRLAGISGATEVLITDAKGTVIQRIQVPAGTIEASINTASLAAGVYSISFQSGRLKSTQQFIKQ